MKLVFSAFRPAIVSTGLFAIVCCGLYPLAVTGVSRLAFAKQADGSLINGPDGKPVGSELLGQNFSGNGYFHSRPSAAGANGYDGSSSSGSNLGPTSQKLADQIRERVAAYRQVNGLAADQAVPADAVTASASGLDPHISPANAGLQAERVGKARGLPLETVRELVASHTDGRSFGIFGEPGVNVVELNLALDAASRARP